MNLPRSPAPPSAALSAEEIAGQIRFGNVQWAPSGDLLFWLEQRSNRGVIVSWDPARECRFDQTTQLSVRAGWGYGGADFGVGPSGLYFLSNNALYRQPPGGAAIRISSELHDCAAPTPSPDGSHLLLVDGSGVHDRLVLYSADGASPLVVDESRHFVMQPSWHPDGKSFVWVGWDHPNMPWDGAGLFVGSIDGRTVHPVAGDPGGETAIFQPCFSPDGRWLSYISDEDGWFNLRVVSSDTHALQFRLREEAEHAPPAWIQGLRSYGWSPDSRRIVGIRSAGGFDELLQVDVGRGESIPIPLPDWTALGQPSISATGQLALTASSSSRPPSILALSSPDWRPLRVRTSLPTVPRPVSHLAPKRLQWDSRGARCFGLWYAPAEGDGPEPPAAVLRVHGGPTSQYRAEFEPEVHFLTGRGLGVLDINYRGSAGYGRRYRRSLDSGWGEFDVSDLCAAAEFVAASGRAAAGRLIAIGGSAGGLTVLLALARRPGLFAGAICRYAVSDLLSLVEETHKFERHYLDRLVGELPAAEALYRDRSPLRQADSIRDPVALFQGAEDRVVPASQTERLVEKLAANGVPYLYRLYAGEGHGWRSSDTIADYYRTVEHFISDVLQGRDPSEAASRS